jgi:ADP-heptose:LPS heptosyltransferase
MAMTHVLVSRLDNLGDVLLAGPAVRAVAAGADRVTMLAGPGGRAAAELLPGVDRVLTFNAPWVGFEPGPVVPERIDAAVRLLAAAHIDQAVVLTSFHQSALPLALLLRLAGVREIVATSEDYAGSLLDVRHPYRPELHEVEQSLSLVATLGYHLPAGDDGSLRVRRPLPAAPPLPEPFVVVHSGASVPSRALRAQLAVDVADQLADLGWGVVVTGGPHEPGLADNVVGGPRSTRIVDLVGLLDLPELAAVLDRADALVCGNTGPAHLAAAVGTPVAQVFAPVVAVERWRPWRVPSRQLGDTGVTCAGCRARRCPFPDQPCTTAVTADEVVGAVKALLERGEAIVA